MEQQQEPRDPRICPECGHKHRTRYRSRSKSYVCGSCGHEWAKPAELPEQVPGQTGLADA